MQQDFEEALDGLVAMGPAGLARFAQGIDPAWISAAIGKATKATVRRRKLPSESVIFLVLGMGLYRDHCIASVVEHLDLLVEGVDSIAPSAVSQARQRLGPQPMQDLFQTVASAWGDDVLEHEKYHGLTLFGVDGTCLRTQDSNANFEYFGKPAGRGGKPNDSGYPQLKLTVLLNLSNRLLCGAAFGPYTTGEQTLAMDLWPLLPAESLVILDRGFIDYEVFADLWKRGEERHFLVRLRANMKPHLLEELPDGSVLAELRPGSKVSSACCKEVPAIRGRVIEYQHDDGKPSRIFVSLTDHERYPASELVELYHARWECELCYKELKVQLLERRECLRSLSPDGVHQELWGLLLVYNLVRHEMLLAARAHNVAPNRISFCSALHWIRSFWGRAWNDAPGTLPRHLASLRTSLNLLILPERRSQRRYPRHVKIKMSNYKRNRGNRVEVALK